MDGKSTLVGIDLGTTNSFVAVMGGGAGTVLTPNTIGESLTPSVVGVDDSSLVDVVVTDVAPYTLGVEISKVFGAEKRAGYFLPVIHRNTTNPCSRMQQLATLEADQTAIQIKVYQGESRKVADNLLLGELEVSGVPRGPAGAEIEIRFTYDLNGVLEVEATTVATVATGRKARTGSHATRMDCLRAH
jgi:molecular chaperone HscC